MLSKTRVNLAYQVVQFYELPLGLGEIMHEDFVGRAAVGRSSGGTGASRSGRWWVVVRHGIAVLTRRPMRVAVAEAGATIHVLHVAVHIVHFQASAK